MKLTAEEFEMMKGWILLKIKHKEERSSEEGLDAIGIRLSELVLAWLEEREGHLQDEEDLLIEKKKIRGVIKRLVNKDGVLIEAFDDTREEGADIPGEENPFEVKEKVNDPIIVIHPNVFV
jgi:hypothetical protein